ncbi:MAG: sensor histidine kinase, partial [Coprococcus sp.]
YVTSGIRSRLSDYLTEDEIEKIALYLDKNREFEYPVSGQSKQYRFLAKINRLSGDFLGFCVDQVTWESNDTEEAAADIHLGGKNTMTRTDDNGVERRFIPVDYETVWEWNDPEAACPERAFNIVYYSIFNAFPYLMSEGYHSWQEWRNSDYLQKTIQNLDASSMEKLLEESINQAVSPGFDARYTSVQSIVLSDDTTGILLLASECHPWLAAIAYMKYVYILCLVLVLICLLIVLYLLGRTEHQQADAEESRRTFTHVLSCEMQIPLATIRKSTEMLKNHASSENRIDYLKQIVKETEKMDHLVADMIDMSKLDSEHLVLQQDILSVTDIIKEQLLKLKPLIIEKELEIHIKENGPFHITGDRKYLTKAIFNLLDNAVSDSNAGDAIDIIIDKKHRSIGKRKITPLLDMLVRKDTGKAEETDPAGTRLYLTKKILDLFRMNMDIQTTKKGLKVIISL